MDLQSLGKLMLVFAVALAITGGVLLLLGRAGVGELPGDLRFEGQGWSCFVPIALSLLLSIVLTVVLNIVIRMLGK